MAMRSGLLSFAASGVNDYQGERLGLWCVCVWERERERLIDFQSWSHKSNQNHEDSWFQMLDLFQGNMLGSSRSHACLSVVGVIAPF